MDSDGTCENSQVSTASCKLMLLEQGPANCLGRGPKCFSTENCLVSQPSDQIVSPPSDQN